MAAQADFWQMPHYHLNLYNDADSMDEHGREFADLASAKTEAIRSSRELMAEHVRTGHPINLSDRIEVANADGKVLATINFRELITINESRHGST